MRLTHVFVDSFPESLEEGKLYVSMRYASVAHLCVCGCGNEVVTPIRKRGWKLTFDGENITLSPSIGNHNLACQSHYFIRESEIYWAGRLTREEIHLGRVANQQGGVDFDTFEMDEPVIDGVKSADEQVCSVDEPEQPPLPRRWWERFRFWRDSPES
jgi:hypothetical protein